MLTRTLAAQLFRTLSATATLVVLGLATCAATPEAQPPTANPLCKVGITPRTKGKPLESIQLLSDTFVLGADRQCLYASKNRGRTFNKVRCAPFAPGVKGLISRFHFSSRAAGWIVTNDGALLRTKNGGASWQALSFPDHVVRDVHFADTRAGFWVGEKLSGGAPDTLPAAFTTGDGGQRWSEVPLPSAAEQRARLEGVWMRPPSEVWTVGDLMLTSTDAGKTWKPAGSPEMLAELRNTSIRFGPRGVGWVLRAPADSYLLTCDGGETWQSRTPPGPGFSALVHVDCKHAYAAAGGSLYRSEDGGTSFHVMLEGDAEAQGYTALAYLPEKRLLMAVSERAVAACQVAVPAL